MEFLGITNEKHKQMLNDGIFSFGKYGIGSNLLTMFVTGVVAFILLIITEMGAFRMLQMLVLKRRGDQQCDSNGLVDDDDVLAEKQRINEMSVEELQSEPMVMQNISKFYGSFQAVKNVSFAAKK